MSDTSDVTAADLREFVERMDEVQAPATDGTWKTPDDCTPEELRAWSILTPTTYPSIPERDFLAAIYAERIRIASDRLAACMEVLGHADKAEEALEIKRDLQRLVSNLVDEEEG